MTTATRTTVRCNISGTEFTTRALLHYSTCPSDNYASAAELRDGETALGSGPRCAFVRDPDRNQNEYGELLYLPVTVL